MLVDQRVCLSFRIIISFVGWTTRYSSSQIINRFKYEHLYKRVPLSYVCWFAALYIPSTSSIYLSSIVLNISCKPI